VNAGVQADMAKSQMPAETGGTVVTTQEAPVAFPRRPEGVSARRASVGGRDFFHIHDLTNPVNTGPSANTFHISYELGVNPGASAATFPNLYTLFENFSRYKVHKLAFHYVHYAPTSVQALVEISYDPDWNGISNGTDPNTTSQMASYRNAVQGACYEDFTLEVDPETLKEIGVGAEGFNFMYPGGGTAGGSINLSYWGGVVVATDQNTPLSSGVGYIWTEAVVEVQDFKSSAFTGVSMPRIRSLLLDPGTSDPDADELIEQTLIRLRAAMKKLREKPLPRTLGIVERAGLPPLPPVPEPSSPPSSLPSRVVTKR
jgi:hypothetical protein